MHPTNGNLAPLLFLTDDAGDWINLKLFSLAGNLALGIPSHYEW